jgi:hypothetical protein
MKRFGWMVLLVSAMTGVARAESFVIPMPGVDAGPDFVGVVTDTITLSGEVHHDSVPVSALQLQWKVVSGSGTIRFLNAHAAKTNAVADRPGRYLLELTATDGVQTNSSKVVVMLKDAPTVALSTYAAVAQMPFVLRATGEPYRQRRSSAMLNWSVLEGPGFATLSSFTTAVTTLTVTDPGRYVFGLRAVLQEQVWLERMTVDVYESTRALAAAIQKRKPQAATVVTGFQEQVSFLYMGPDAPQTDVSSGALKTDRLAVARGRVETPQGEPLKDAIITAAGHPDWGKTKTRADGTFDFVLQGSQTVILQIAKAGYAPLEVARDFAVGRLQLLPALALQPETSFASLPMGNAFWTAPAADEQGLRQTAIWFDPPLSTGTVRARGAVLAAHAGVYPGPILDENALRFGFSWELQGASGQVPSLAGVKAISYTENYLKLPVGAKVPTLRYENQAWKPGAAGQVIRLLAAQDGIAILDVEGRGQPASPEVLQQLGIADAERRWIASTYGVGASLWRAPLSGPGLWQFAWALVPPTQMALDRLAPISPMVAAPTLTLPLTGKEIPPQLRSIEVDIVVAGQRSTQRFGSTTALTTAFQWNGENVYRQPLSGPQPVLVQVRYGLEGATLHPDLWPASAASTPEVRQDAARPRGTFVATRQWQGAIAARLQTANR